jgi:hypothetical protein
VDWAIIMRHEIYSIALRQLIEAATTDGLVLTIELVPIGHAAGSYKMVPAVRDSHEVMRAKMERESGMNPAFAAPYEQAKGCGTCAHSYRTSNAVGVRLGCHQARAASGWEVDLNGFQLPSDGADCDMFKVKP